MKIFGMLIILTIICSGIFYLACNATTPTTLNPLIANENNSWNLETIKLDDFTNIKNIFFCNESIGYLVEQQASTIIIRKTQDRAKNWQKVSTFEDALFQSINFSDCQNGYLTITKTVPSSVLNDNESQIFKTNDEGKTWSKIHTEEHSILRKIIEIDNNLFAIGEKYKSSGSVSNNLILNSKDGGINWNDISPNLSKTKIDSAQESSERLVDIIHSKQNGLVVLSNNLNKIFNSPDFGQTWNLLSNIEINSDEVLDHGSLIFNRLTEISGKDIWLIGNAASKTKTFSIFSQVENNQIVRKYRFDNISISDVKSISETEILAVGYSQPTQQTSNGVVLYSNDNGHNWQNITQIENEQFHSIQVISEDKIFVSGINGNVLVVSRKNKAV